MVKRQSMRGDEDLLSKPLTLILLMMIRDFRKGLKKRSLESIS